LTDPHSGERGYEAGTELLWILGELCPGFLRLYEKGSTAVHEKSPVYWSGRLLPLPKVHAVFRLALMGIMQVVAE
jgi:hypothetical protein